MSQRIHLSIGPVQEFIADSRRTRDLWASSYLLSFLAGRGMAAVLEHDPDNHIELPGVTRGELLGLYGKDATAKLPAHATLPNRFVARAHDAEAAAKHAAEAIQKAWRQIAEAVYSEFVAPVENASADQGKAARAIWERQVNHFWDITWVVGDPALLDARKHWRARRMRSEPGEHCTMMGAYQELSGFVGHTEGRKTFWDAVRERTSELALRKDERLCAIALIKRLVLEVYQDAFGRSLDKRTLAWPSTLYIAAWPWLEHVCATQPAAAAAYAEHARQARHELGEYGTAKRLREEHPKAGAFPALDGNFFFANSLGNENATPFDKNGDDDLRESLVKELGELTQEAKRKPTPFFALLLMDGDNMGALLKDADDAGRTKVTSALTDFSKRVPTIVTRLRGHTLYAGGDDVLAFLPVDSAMDAALQLAHAYRACFDKYDIGRQKEARATLSGALVFAHYHLSLRHLIRTAHRLLDDVAKDQTGRDSLAVALLRTSGETARWAVPFLALHEDLDSEHPAPLDLAHTCLGPLVEIIRNETLASSALYRLRGQLARMSERDEPGPGKTLRVPPGMMNPGNDTRLADLHELESMTGLIAAELQTDRARGREPAELQRVARELLRTMPSLRRTAEGAIVTTAPDVVTFDGAHLASFLANPDAEEQR